MKAEYERSFDGGKTWGPLDARIMRTVDRASQVDHDRTLLELDAGFVLDAKDHGLWRKKIAKSLAVPAGRQVSLF